MNIILQCHKSDCLTSRLSSILKIEYDKLRLIDFDEIIANFAAWKAQKKMF